MDTWLVQIIVNPQCRRVLKGSKINGHALHQELMRLAPHGLGENPRQQAGLLYRAEQAGNGLRVLAQLQLEPRLEEITEDFALNLQQRRLTPLLDTLAAGMRVRYRIDANATKRHGNAAPENKRGKLANLHGTDADLWWLRKAGEAGLHPLQLISAPQTDILGGPSQPKSPSHNAENNTKSAQDDTKDYTASHGVTRFEGIGIVTDPERLRAAVAAGIGRARTYGCGMLSIGPTPESP